MELVYQKWSASAPGIKKLSLEIPGFAGKNKTYEEAQPWQCKPFVDANTMGFEVCWGLDCDVVIESDDGITAKIKDTWTAITKNSASVQQFAAGHVGVNSHYQISLPNGWGGMILPHPKWFADPFGSEIPYVIPGYLEFDWWPRFFFVVVQVPPPGKIVTLRAHQPFFQVIPIPKNQKITARSATDEEKRKRNFESEVVAENYSAISTHNWQTKNGKTFGNAYKVLAAEIKKNGTIDWEDLKRQFE